MVSFQCDGCADTVKKPKLDQHRQRCYASFTCLDCSTTFQDQSYKSHTTCISEAEKYQGALYKGPKKGKQNAQSFSAPPAQTAPASAPPVETPTPTSNTPAVHPSRAGIVSLADSGAGPSHDTSRVNGGYGRGDFGGRGRGRGRGGFQGGGRGGFGGPNGPGGPVRYSATGENRSGPAGGMRSWGTNTPAEGSPVPVPEQAVQAAAAAPVPAAETSKPKKKKKGDKGGTGSKANSKNPAGSTTQITTPVEQTTTPVPAATAVSEEPDSKKRKRDPSPVPALAAASVSTYTEPLSDKTIKRLRKNLSKLDADGGVASRPLSEVLSLLGKGKKDQPGVSAEDVLRAVKVGSVDGKLVLSV